tara:strand:+ start:665 stop:2974 length:2310 start_codon:yes stop_codon:yes gene_type:complete
MEEFTQPADYTRSLQESFQFSNQGDARNQRAMQVNQEVDQRTAGQTMSQLAELSKTASGIVKHYAEKQVENQRAEGNLWMLNNQNSIDVQTQIDELTADMQEMDASAEDINKAVKEMRDKNENIFLTDGFKRLSPQAKIGAKIAYIQSKASEFQFDTEYGKYTDSADFRAQTDIKFKEFFKSLNLEGGNINKAMIAKYANPVLLEKRSAHHKGFYAHTKKEMLAQETDERHFGLDTALKAGNMEEFFRLIGVNEGQLGSLRLSRLEAMGRAEKLASQGLLPDGLILKLKDTVVTVKGQKKQVKLGDYYSDEISKIETAKTDYDKKEYNKKNLEINIGVQNFKANTRAEYLALPEGAAREEFLEKTKTEFEKDFPFQSSDWISDKLKTSSATAVADEEVSKWVEKGIATRTITMDQLYDANVSPAVINKYKGQIQVIESQMGNRNYWREKSSVVVQAGAKNTINPDSSVADMEDTFFTRVEQLAQEKAILDKNPDGKRDYWAEAFDEVRTSFETNRSKFVHRRGFKKVLPEDLAESSPEWNAAIKDMNNKIKSVPPEQAINLAIQTEEGAEKETLFYTQSGLEAETKGYGEYGWEPSPKLEYLANLYGITPRDFLSKQRVAVGLKPLGETQEEIQFNILNGRDKNILSRNRKSVNSAEVAAMWGTKKVEQGDGTFKEFLVPLKDEVKVEYNNQKESGATESSIASILEMIENADEYGGINSYKDIVDNPYAFIKYNQGIYKISNNPEEKQAALDHTANRFDVNTFLLNIK